MGITKKQKEVFDYIMNYTKSNGYAPTQKEIKEHFELKSYGSVQRYLSYLTEAGYLERDWNARRGLRPTPRDPLTGKIALEDNSPLQLPVGRGTAHPPGQATSSHGPLSHHAHSEMIELPLLGKVAAGNPIESLEHPDETFPVSPHMLKGRAQHFGLRVVGDSMIEDGILEDDIIICRVQKTAERGQRVVAVINGEATVKSFHQKGRHIELHPANANYSPIIVGEDVESFELAGVVVGLIRNYE